MDTVRKAKPSEEGRTVEEIVAVLEPKSVLDGLRMP
jgi:hypothetical protein